MATAQIPITSEQESRQVAEQARQTEWEGRGFLRDLFLGKFQLDLIHPFPLDREERPEFTEFRRELEQFLRDYVDPIAIDRTGEYPAEVIAGLKRLGAFGMKIPKEYGGLGFSNFEDCRGSGLIRSFHPKILGLLLPPPSISVPPPLQ